MNHSTLLCPDASQTVIRTAWSRKALPTTAFGFCDRRNFQVHRNGLNGELIELLTGHYPLGNGHRGYNPQLMRFHSPDTLSPFSRGSFNAYAYCQADPINWRDPSGRWRAPKWPYWGGFSPINFFPIGTFIGRQLRPGLPVAAKRIEPPHGAAHVVTPPAITEAKRPRTRQAPREMDPISLIDAPAAVRDWVLAAARAGAGNGDSTLVPSTDGQDEWLRATLPRHGYVPLSSVALLSFMARLRSL